MSTPQALRCPGRRSGRHLPAPGCRCLVDAAPTHRMIKALASAGWSLDYQGQACGIRGHAVWFLLRREHVRRSTAIRVAALYDRLIGVPGPSCRSISYAARHGWDVVDHIVVERLVSGVECPHNRAERDAAIRILAKNGLLLNSIANRVHSSIPIVRRVIEGVAA